MSKGNELITVDTKDFEKLIVEFRYLPKEMMDATRSALNRSLAGTRTYVKRIITEEYAIVKKPNETYRMKQTSASGGDLTAGLVVTGHLLSFGHFPFTPQYAGTRQPVSVRIKRTEGYKSPGSSVFVAPTGGKGAAAIRYNVFRRVGQARKPIVVLRTLSVPQMISRDDIAAKISEFAMVKLGERIDHEMTWRLDRIRGKR